MKDNIAQKYLSFRELGVMLFNICWVSSVICQYVKVGMFNWRVTFFVCSIAFQMLLCLVVQYWSHRLFGGLHLFCFFNSVEILLLATGCRMKEKGFLKEKVRNPFIISDDMLNVQASSRKEDKLQKQNVHCSDGAKYMSYFKVGICFINHISLLCTHFECIIPG